MYLDQISNIHWHLLDLSRVELFDVSKVSDIISSQEVDSNSLSSETSGSSDSVDVILSVGWEIEVDDKGNLLHIDTSGKKIGGDKNSGRSGSELSHNDLSLSLVHISVLKRRTEVKRGGERLLVLKSKKETSKQ